MGKSVLIALSNPVSAEREDEFNQWYDTTHRAEVMALPGFISMSRFRASVQLLPPSEIPTYRYLGLYEVEDSQEAVKALLAANFVLSEAMDFAGAMGIAFDQIS